jgi:outer membrane protein OmpA-like peptidoglycan-associated protein
VTSLVLLALALGCSSEGDTPAEEHGAAAAEAPRSAAPGSSGLGTADSDRGMPGAVDVEWIDPEPPEAQAVAEQVVGAPWNRDKSTRLKMHITSLVDHTTGIVGFESALRQETSTIEERLERLGAEVGEQEVTIRLPGSVLFDFDSADIRPDAERTLSELLGVLEAWPERPVRIEGHTDSIASDEYNQALSERRAGSVRDWLVGRGISGDRLTTVGFGESRPVADNSSAAGRQLNRRVEVVIGKAP